jgi:ABC-type glutathione transport system ATPase component
MIHERVDELVDLMGLDAFRNKFVAELSTGSRRIVELACILAHRPRVLLLDEPSSGIAQRETEALGPLIRRIRDQLGCSILIIEHDIPLIRSLADHMVGLDLGRVVAYGRPEEVLSDPSVVESYLGAAAEKLSIGMDRPRAAPPTPAATRQARGDPPSPWSRPGTTVPHKRPGRPLRAGDHDRRAPATSAQPEPTADGDVLTAEDTVALEVRKVMASIRQRRRAQRVDASVREADDGIAEDDPPLAIGAQVRGEEEGQ